MVEVTEKMVTLATGPWRARETCVFFPGGGFDVSGCPDPEQLASFIAEAVNAYAAALASPAEVGEPVAWMRHNPGFLDRPTANPPSEADRAKGITASPLYLHPPQQEPARLREEIERLEKALETAREDAIEEAAKMAEADFRTTLEKTNGHIPDWLAHGRRIAGAIRALSQKKEG